MNESKERKRGVILSYVSIIVTTIIQLLYTPLLIRKLGQSEYGLYSLVSSIIGYLTILDLGFGNAIVVYTAKYRAQGKYEEEKKLQGMFKIIFWIIGVIIGIIGFILFLNVDNIFGNTMTEIEIHKAKIMMLILSFNLMITFSFSIYSSIISAYERYTYQKIIPILNTVLKPILMIPLLFMGFKSITLTIVITLLNILVLLSNFLYCRKKLNIKLKFRGFDKALFKTIFGYSFFIFLGVVVDKINWSVDKFVLGAISGTAAVSIYTVASQINILFINLSGAISGVLLPKMSKMVNNKVSNDEITNEFIKIGRLQYFVIFLMASGLVLFGKEFIELWAGMDYTLSYYIALFLIIPVCIPLIQNLGISIMQAKNKHKFRAVLLVFISIANIIISIPLAKKYGGIGSAIGTSIAVIVGDIIIMNIYYYKVIKINIIKFWKEIIKMTISFAIPVALILLIMSLTELTGLMSIIVYGSIYTLIYCLMCFKVTMNSYERALLENILTKFKHNN